MTIQQNSRIQKSPVRQYWEAGLNPIAIRSDGTKAAAEPWLDYQKRRAREDEIKDWEQRYDAFALINGSISQGQETIDVDDPQCVEALLEKIDPTLRSRLVINATPSGGMHILTRCSIVSPSMKIAHDENGKVRIESRGEGAYTIAPGSAASTHRSGNLYAIRQWPNFPRIPLITQEERVHIWQCCLAFDNTDRKVEAERKKLLKSSIERYTSRSHASRTATPVTGELARQELIKCGWTTADNQSFARPGKSGGVSGKFNTALEDGKEIFTVFSTNAGDLSPESGHVNWSLAKLVNKLRSKENI